MKNLFLSLLVLFFFSCEKDADKSGRVTGTVQIKSGCFQNSWLVAIDNPDPSRHSFICEDAILAGTVYNCTNAVYIVDLPAHLAQTEKKIRFSVREEVASCLSYSFAPTHVQATSIQAFP